MNKRQYSYSRRILKTIISLVLFFSMLSLLGCIGARHIFLTPLQVQKPIESINQIPFSVHVEFMEVKNKYGPGATPMILDTENLRVSLSDILKKRGTFPKRKVKMIKGNYSDFILKARVANLALLQNWSTKAGWQYSVAVEARLINRNDEVVGTYRGESIVKSGRNIRLTTKDDSDPVNKAMYQSFRKICRQLENDYAENKIICSTKSVEKDTWNHIESILIDALNDDDPELRLEAIWDLSEGILEGHFEEKSSTTDLLVSKLMDNDLDVRFETVDALASLGNSGDHVIPELIDVLREYKDEEMCAYAALSLAKINSEIIDRYRDDAISLLVESFPIITIVRELRQDITYPTEIIGMVFDRVDHKILDEKDPIVSQMIEGLVSQYDGYLLVNKYEGVKSRYTYETTLLGQDLEQKSTVIFVKCDYTIYAGPYAIYKMTGENLGIDKDKWLEWLKRDK